MPGITSHLATEVSTQPADWLRAAARGGEIAEVVRPGQRVAVIGCGTSWFMAQSYATLREGRGDGVTDAWSASEHHLDRGYDAVVLISRSGTTTEVVEALGWVQAHGVPHLAIVATAGTPIAASAERTVLMSEVDEQSVVQTRFATSTLAMLRASLGDDVSRAAEQAAEVLAEPAETVLNGVLAVEQVSFLGRGWTVGLASEAALKLRESAQAWTESYPAMEYRHGPIAIATTGRATWAFGAVPEGLAEQVRATGAHFEHRDIDPMAELVRVHRLCLARAEAAGLDADSPRHLTRSIILS